MPQWCDLTCPEAQWPKDADLDGSNSCRTFLALYCKKYRQITMKNGLCLDRKDQTENKKKIRVEKCKITKLKPR
jgi:hypothetical protein